MSDIFLPHSYRNNTEKTMDTAPSLSSQQAREKANGWHSEIKLNTNNIDSEDSDTTAMSPQKYNNAATGKDLPSPTSATTITSSSVHVSPDDNYSGAVHMSQTSPDLDNTEARLARVIAIYLPHHPYIKVIVMYSLQYIFILELFFYWFPIFINYGVFPQIYKCNYNNYDNNICTQYHYQNAVAVFTLFHLFSFIVIIMGTALLWFELSHHIVKPAHLTWMYFAIIVHYASWYNFIFAITADSMYVLGNYTSDTGSLDPSSDLANRGILHLYTSISVMTTVGLGDVYPIQWYGKIIAITQMIMGLLYTTGIFGIGLEHFRKTLNATTSTTSGGNSSNIVNRNTHSIVKSIRDKYPRLEQIRKFLVNQLFLVTAGLQIILMCLLIAVYGHDTSIFDTSSPQVSGINALCIIIEIVLFLIISLASLRLINHNKNDVSLSFLLQSYLSVILLFSGIFFTIYLLAGENSFILNSFNNNSYNNADSTIPKVLGEFIWFSFVVMSTTGFGDVVPIHTAARIFVSIEMLLSIFYMIIVLGIAMLRTMQSWNANRVELPPMPDEVDTENDDINTNTTDNNHNGTQMTTMTS